MDAIAFALGENWENLRVSDLLKLIYCEKSQNPKPNRFVKNNLLKIFLFFKLTEN